jgi:hypothetical protein
MRGEEDTKKEGHPCRGGKRNKRKEKKGKKQKKREKEK